MTKRRLEDLSVRFTGGMPNELIVQRLPAWCRAGIVRQQPRQSADIEIAFAGGDRFSTQADCRVLLIPPGHTATSTQLRQAHLLFVDGPVNRPAEDCVFPWRQMDGIMRQQLGFMPPNSRKLQTVPPVASEFMAAPAAA